MKKYRIERLPKGFSEIAHAAHKALEGEVYAVGNQLEYTQEGDVTEAFESFEKLERWLLLCASDWLAEAAKNGEDPMAAALEKCLYN